MEIGQNFTVRPVKLADSRRIWEIRNHPLVRAASNNSQKIAFEDHEPWFKKKYFGAANNRCWVLEDKKEGVIGYCRFDYDEEKSAHIASIALNPEYHGQGLGHYLLSESLRQFGHNKVVAEIKKSNIPSIKLFKRNNFEVYKEDGNLYYLGLM